MTICGVLAMFHLQDPRTDRRRSPGPAVAGPGLRAVGSGTGRSEVVDRHAAGRGGGVVALDPAGDLARRARSSARSATHAATHAVAGDEVVDESLLHPFL